jgi:STE24 endopeptidase
MRVRLLLTVLLAFTLSAACSVHAQPAEPKPTAPLSIPDDARPGATFDVERATRAYLASVPADERARSDAYFEGGYWLRLWDAFYTVGIAALLLFGRVSAALRDRAQRITRRRWLQALIYAAAFIVVFAVLLLPLNVYEDWYRERAYGLSNLTFAAWLGEAGKRLAITLALGAPLLAIIAVVVRRHGGNWWLPASAISGVFLVFVTFIEPVYLAPVFNDYHTLGKGDVRDSVLSLARANGVGVDQVYWFDASKQTSRISANVSGLLGTTRISLNDNLLARTSLPEISAVMAHELGHFVLDHSTKLLIELGLVLVVGFAVAQALQQRLLARYGARWGLSGPSDIAGIPLVIALLTLWSLVTTPVTNSIVRANESEADLFSLNASREPHAFATVVMRLATYRKLAPTPLEEAIFYDHPSGQTRVRMAMRWFAEHQDAGAGGQR